MIGSSKKLLMGAAGSATGGAGLDIDEVFSTYLYEGTGSAQTITNGIDLSGEGGMVWVKGRNSSSWEPSVLDTERGTGQVLFTNRSDVFTSSSWITSFNTDGFTVGGSSYTNNNSDTYASWTFRKAPKFFDVVTWTGDGTSNRAIPHDLGGAVGSYFVKCTSHGTASDWIVWHKDLASNSDNLVLNTTAAVDNNSLFSTTAPDSSNVYLGTANLDYFNATGRTYVAYLFAHNDGDGGFGDGSQDIIKCGSYTGNGSSTGPEIDLGFEPQWIMVKKATAVQGTAQDWFIFDSMRGWLSGSSSVYGSLALRPNSTAAEWDRNDPPYITSTGFRLNDAADRTNGNGDTYIYMAIRRGPLAVPEDATEVFEPTVYTGNGQADRTIGNLTVDMNIIIDRTNTSQGLNDYHTLFDRVRGEDVVLKLNRTDAEGNGWGNTFYNLDQQYGFSNGSNTLYFNKSGASYISYIWKRAPGYFDAVTYSGNSTTGRTVSHNLGVAPEMMWIKARGGSEPWYVYHASLGTAYSLRLNGTFAAVGDSVSWNSTEPTSSEFTLGSHGGVNNSSLDYIAYLFASVPGVSKVGGYTGSGSSAVVVDCGFSSSARFVLIKRTDNTGDWYIYDSARGIVSGGSPNDPYLLLNSTSAEVTNTNWIAPNAVGFALVWSSSSTSQLNLAGANYIFYAIA